MRRRPRELFGDSVFVFQRPQRTFNTFHLPLVGVAHECFLKRLRVLQQHFGSDELERIRLKCRKRQNQGRDLPAKSE